jgi:exfoliative toxin A/B
MNMKKMISKIPVPMAGLMLGLASAGNLVASYGTVYKNIFGAISALLLLLLIAKTALNFNAIKDDLKNPVIAGVSATLPMGIMILSTYIKAGFPKLAYAMWIMGIAIHILLILYFTQRFILHFDIKKVFPTYFVVYVGIVVASLTAPAFNAVGFGRIIFWFGFISYLILLPIVIYRVFAVKSIPEPAQPTIAIFAAPASLCLAGYMNSFQTKNMTLVWILVILSSIMLLLVIMKLPGLLNLKFYPSYSAFTFPFVISAVAIKSTNVFLVKSNILVPALNYVVKLEEILAVCLVVYVLVRYINFLFAIKPNNNAIKTMS